MSNSSAMSSPFAGIPFRQLEKTKLFIYYDDAGGAMAYTLGNIDTLMQDNMVTVIHAGVRIAAAVLLGVVLVLVARSFKSFMFALYETNMVLMLIGSALQVSYTFGAPSSIAIATTGGDIPRGGLRLGVATTVFQMLLTFSLLASLVAQIHAAHSDQRRAIQWGVTVIALIGCFPTILIWLWRTVLIGIANANPVSAAQSWNANQPISSWVRKGAWPAFAASTSFCSLILCVKLWIVHRKRAKLGLKHYDPIKIIFVMALQNSVIPAILAIVSASLSSTNFGAESVSAVSIILTAVLLPTGYIWAQFQLLKGSQANDKPSRPHALDIEKAKSSVITQSETYTATTDNSGSLLHYSDEACGAVHFDN